VIVIKHLLHPSKPTRQNAAGCVNAAWAVHRGQPRLKNDPAAFKSLGCLTVTIMRRDTEAWYRTWYPNALRRVLPGPLAWAAPPTRCKSLIYQQNPSALPHTWILTTKYRP